MHYFFKTKIKKKNMPDATRPGKPGPTPSPMKQ